MGLVRLTAPPRCQVTTSNDSYLLRSVPCPPCSLTSCPAPSGKAHTLSPSYTAHTFLAPCHCLTCVPPECPSPTLSQACINSTLVCSLSIIYKVRRDFFLLLSPSSLGPLMSCPALRALCICISFLLELLTQLQLYLLCSCRLNLIEHAY
jgi:hypothetical protein